MGARRSATARDEDPYEPESIDDESEEVLSDEDEDSLLAEVESGDEESGEMDSNDEMYEPRTVDAPARRVRFKRLEPPDDDPPRPAPKRKRIAKPFAHANYCLLIFPHSAAAPQVPRIVGVLDEELTDPDYRRYDESDPKFLRRLAEYSTVDGAPADLVALDSNVPCRAFIAEN